MQLNWIDAVILGTVAFYVLDGWEQGLVRLVSSLLSFLASLYLAIRFYATVGEFLVEKFGLASSWGNVIGFAATALIVEAVISKGVWRATKGMNKKAFTSYINKILGSVLSVSKGIVIVTMVLLLLQILPLRGTVRTDISQSVLAKTLVQTAERLAPDLKSTFEDSARQAIRFLTVRPASTERINLDIAPGENLLSVNRQAERRMLEMVNADRVKEGLRPLVVDEAIAGVARAHSRDMFVRRYFSHVSPEGLDAADRLDAANIRFTLAGENLAYAPDVQTAHEGLMNSEGHRKNILTAEFGKVGIGVIDAGVYGMMFTQNFTD